MTIDPTLPERPLRGGGRAAPGAARAMLVVTVAALAAALLLAACSREPAGGTAGATPATTAAAATTTGGARAAASPRPPIRDALTGGPYPALLVTQAQFDETVAPDGTKRPVPGYAKLLIVRKTDAGWRTVTLEDPDSNAFHKALPFEGGLLTIGATQAMLKTWRFVSGAWAQETHWNPKFGGKFDRLRDVERGDVDGDHKDELVIATHDQGVIAVVHPDDGWRVEEIDRQPDTFGHEIELGDADGDGTLDVFVTVSKPNTLEREQPGEVRMYRYGQSGWRKSIVDAPGDTHAKEILATDLDRNGVAELFAVWEGAVGPGGALVRPVTIKEYKLLGNGSFAGTEVVTLPDRQTRAITAGDVNGDGKIDLVAGALSSGLWLIEQDGAGWKKTLIDADSTGFEQPVHVADLDGDGALEIYVASEDQHELRQYRWRNGAFEKTVIAQLHPGDISWNITSGRF
jgi:hypothetical protein